MGVGGGGLCACGRQRCYVCRSQPDQLNRAGRRGGKLYIAVPLTKEVCCDVVTDDHGDGEEAPEETLKNVLSDKVSLRAQHEEGQVRPAKLGEREGGEGGKEGRRGGERRGGNEGGEEGMREGRRKGRQIKVGEWGGRRLTMNTHTDLYLRRR